MSLHRALAADLSIVIWASAAHVIAAVPLKPSAGILVVDPSLFALFCQWLRSIDSEKVQAGLVSF